MSNFLYDAFVTGQPSPEYQKYEKGLKKALAQVVKKEGKCIAKCTIDYVVGGVTQATIFKLLEKKAVDALALKIVGKALTYYSRIGLIKCVVECDQCSTEE